MRPRDRGFCAHGSRVVATGLKRERLERSTDESDAVKLEILREMHALYVVEVEKRWVLPSLKDMPKKRKKILVDKYPDKDSEYTMCA